jgi:hypothetical protein
MLCSLPGAVNCDREFKHHPLSTTNAGIAFLNRMRKRTSKRVRAHCSRAARSSKFAHDRQLSSVIDVGPGMPSSKAVHSHAGYLLWQGESGRPPRHACVMCTHWSCAVQSPATTSAKRCFSSGTDDYSLYVTLGHCHRWVQSGVVQRLKPPLSAINRS